jgi:glycosyltransferase involved in cell wall biosynthesis
VVYVGGFSPHKNVDMLVRVFDRIRRDVRFDDVRLYLVGDHEQESFVSAYPDLVRLVDALGLGARVTFTGFLPDDDLVVLLNLASVLALPSLTEGFGLPAIEAAACGCPVVATTESPLSSVLGKAGRFVDPRDESALERALRDVLGSRDLRQTMSAAGVDAAGRLSWPAAARRLVPLITGEPGR